MEADAERIGVMPSIYCKIAQFAAVLAYYWLISFIDRTVLAPAFGYQGLMYRSASSMSNIAIVGLILFCTALTPVRLRRPSDGVLYILLPLVVIPVFAVASTDLIFAAVAPGLIASIAGAYILLTVCSMLPRPIRNPALWQPWRRPWILAIILSVASYALMFTTFGAHLRLLSFNDVYGIRAVFNEQASGLTGYLLDWQANVVNPLFIVYGIRYRRTFLVIAGVLGDLLIYSTTGFKSVLFSVLAITVFLFSMRQKKPKTKLPATGMRLSIAFAVLVAIADVIDTFSHTIVWTSLFVRRLSLVAGVNTGYYFQYFTVEPKTHLAYGLVGRILGSATVMPPPQQIAIAAYHSAGGDPNANMWADAYSSFGYMGVIGFTLVLAGFLWIYDRAAQDIDRRAATVLLVAPALSLANSALLTCLLTHGLLLSLLVITQWPRLARQDEVSEDLRARHGSVGLARSAGP